MNINSALVDVVDVEQPADVVEFCPIPTCENILACGTYLLNERERSKTGKILLYQCSNKPSTLVEVNRVDTPAILDLRWFVILLFIYFVTAKGYELHQKSLCALLVLIAVYGCLNSTRLPSGLLLLKKLKVLVQI